MTDAEVVTAPEAAAPVAIMEEVSRVTAKIEQVAQTENQSIVTEYSNTVI